MTSPIDDDFADLQPSIDILEDLDLEYLLLGDEESTTNDAWINDLLREDVDYGSPVPFSPAPTRAGVKTYAAAASTNGSGAVRNPRPIQPRTGSGPALANKVQANTRRPPPPSSIRSERNREQIILPNGTIVFPAVPTEHRAQQPADQGYGPARPQTHFHGYVSNLQLQLEIQEQRRRVEEAMLPRQPQPPQARLVHRVEAIDVGDGDSATCPPPPTPGQAAALPTTSATAPTPPPATPAAATPAPRFKRITAPEPSAPTTSGKRKEDSAKSKSRKKRPGRDDRSMGSQVPAPARPSTAVTTTSPTDRALPSTSSSTSGTRTTTTAPTPGERTPPDLVASPYLSRANRTRSRDHGRNSAERGKVTREGISRRVANQAGPYRTIRPHQHRGSRTGSPSGPHLEGDTEILARAKQILRDIDDLPQEGRQFMRLYLGFYSDKTIEC